ncbi:hypothetical protein NARC_10189 [Candidatus Nitrosocosmicus arcticus]|uniref:Uncharacterized protein n=1 Tax=Candidatus Nitrosocosmicus arcticus TaxID=2035267 RepID=A0A557SYW9_9ARCH|nr:hypothetical protein NARC_10189 [Candidatus Nitrosocosmicus arcticus]
MSNLQKATNTKTFGLSVPKEVFKLIEENRGDISRSKYIVRAIERSLIK